MGNRRRFSAWPYAALAPESFAWHKTSPRAGGRRKLVMQTVPTPAPDPLLETQVFWSRYQRQILIALVALIVAIALYGAYRLYLSRRDAAAAALLANAKSAPEFQKIIADYPSAGAAAPAYLLLAAQQRTQQQFAEANGTLDKFISANSKHQLLTTAKMAKAANLESSGKVDEALEMYRRVAADHAQDFNAPLAMLAQVPLLKQKGQIEEARRVCETVLTQYRESYAAMEATRYLKTLKPAAPAASAAPVPPPSSSVVPTP